MVSRRSAKAEAHQTDETESSKEDERNAKLLASFAANQSLDPRAVQPVVTMINDESGVVGEGA
jgi:hypothetical protein